LLSRNVKVKIYKTTIPPVVLYGCETWSLTLRGKHQRLRGFENMVVRRKFGPKRDEVTGEWRQLHSDELRNLKLIPKFYGHQIKENEVGGTCGTHGRGGKRTSLWWESPNEKGLMEDRGVDVGMGSERILRRLAGSVESIQLAQDRGRWRALVNTVINLRILELRG
jgi:hypothetical protein